MLVEQTQPIFSVFYFPPIEFFHHVINSEDLTFDIGENFVKQGYRNRCSILGANGKLNLIVPIIGKGVRTPMKEVKIAYFENWQKIHWKSIESAYRRSPYFEYYEDEFYPLFHNYQPEKLVDFNLKILELIFRVLEMECKINISEKYIEMENSAANYRTLSPKKSPDLSFEKYIQVFQQDDFIENLSILDLIFNEGPNARQYLINSVKQH